LSNRDDQKCSLLLTIAKTAGGTQMNPAALANVLKMSNIEHFSAMEQCNYVAVKAKELTLKQILSVPCPTCGAAIEEACELHTGARRTEPHRNRKLSAAEAVERSQSKR
jgi:hypothetical protein